MLKQLARNSCENSFFFFLVPFPLFFKRKVYKKEKKETQMKLHTHLTVPTSLVIVIMVLFLIFNWEVGLPPQRARQGQETRAAANRWDGWRLQARGVRSERHGKTMSMRQMLGLELLLLWKTKHRYWICPGTQRLSNWSCTWLITSTNMNSQEHLRVLKISICLEITQLVNFRLN